MALDLCPYHGERLLPPPMMSQPGLLLNGAAEAGDAVPLSPYHSRCQSKEPKVIIVNIYANIIVNIYDNPSGT